MRTNGPHVELRGITWNHTRGLLPMVATAQRFGELHQVDVQWSKRSLQSFADAPLAELAESFDLLVLDHPSIGEAHHHGILLPLDDLLPETFLQGQASSSIGQSHASYHYSGHQYALAIDAATPVAGWRQDLLDRAGAELPRTWEDVLALARRGLVTVPAIPIDSLMNFFMLVNALGDAPFSSPKSVAPDRRSGVEALRRLRELLQLSAEGSLQRNPIKTWDVLASSEDTAYCPFAYGYSNYSRAGYADHRLTTGGLVSLNGKTLRSTLGGAGLAISSHCKHPAEALEYAAFVASGSVQRTLYTVSGGQPGHRSAWQDETLNQLTNNFFSNTLPTLDAAWMRPRWPGFIAFQDAAATLVHGYLQTGRQEEEVLSELDDLLLQQPHAGGQA